MKIIISILFNALILYAITFFLPGVDYSGGLKFFFVGGLILGILNFFVRPILKLFGLPFILFTFGLFILVINGIILFLLEKIILALNIGEGIDKISFSINGLNFVIAVAIFTIFNTIYNTFIKK